MDRIVSGLKGGVLLKKPQEFLPELRKGRTTINAIEFWREEIQKEKKLHLSDQI